MSGHTAQRTLVKSPPELWAELSDSATLAKHLGEFGEIRITRLEPETVVAWEGDRANGTVSLEPAGWGTKVTLTAEAVAAPEEPEPVAIEEPEPVAIQAPATIVEPEAPPAEPKRTLFARLRRMWSRGDAATWQLSDHAPEPEADEVPAPEPPAAAEPEPPADEPPAATPLAEEAIAGVLTDTLDMLGAAHHRPFSRG